MKKIKIIIVNFLKGLSFIQNSDLSELDKKFVSLESLTSLRKELDSLRELLTPEKIKKVLDPNLYEFPEKDLKIRVSKGTNIDMLVFGVSKPCWNDASPRERVESPFKDLEGLSYKNSPQFKKFLGRIVSFDWVTAISSINAHTIQIEKTSALSWDPILPKALEAIVSNFPDVEETTKKEIAAYDVTG